MSSSNNPSPRRPMAESNYHFSPSSTNSSPRKCDISNLTDFSSSSSTNSSPRRNMQVNAPDEKENFVHNGVLAAIYSKDTSVVIHKDSRTGVSDSTIPRNSSHSSRNSNTTSSNNNAKNTNNDASHSLGNIADSSNNNINKIDYNFDPFESEDESNSEDPTNTMENNPLDMSHQQGDVGQPRAPSSASINLNALKNAIENIGEERPLSSSGRGLQRPYTIAATPTPSVHPATEQCTTAGTEGRQDALARKKTQAYPTELHAACAQPKIAARTLQAVLLKAQVDQSTKQLDSSSRLPLHLLGMNEHLISLFLKESKATTASASRVHGLPTTELDDFCMELVKSNRHGCITVDNEGHIPFCKILRSWVVLACHGNLPKEKAEGTLGDLIDEGMHVTGGVEDLEEGHATSGPIRLPASNNTQLEGMENIAAMTQKRQVTNNIRDEDTIGSRSVWTSLTNLTMPSAFKSVYAATGERSDLGANTRALYRDQEDTEHLLDGKQISTANGVTPNSAPGAFFSRDDRSLGSFSSAPGATNGIEDSFPEHVFVPAVVEWSLKMLSAMVDYLESCPAILTDEDDDGTVMGTWQALQRERTVAETTTYNNGNPRTSEWIAKTLISAVSSVPSIMKTLLLLDDKDPAKQRLFNLTVVKRMIYNPHTIGNWIVYMLEAVDSDVATRGVQYMEMLSSNPETPDCYGGSALNVYSRKGAPTQEERVLLYNKVARLDYIQPAILALESIGSCERVARTHLMRHIQDQELMRKSTLLMAFFDLLFHLMLLLSFQVATFYYLNGGEYGNRYLVTFFMGFACIIYRIAWKLAQMMSMIKISRNALTSNSFRLGDLFIDWLPAGMAMGGYLWMEFTIDDENEVDNYMRGYLAVTIGMLWLSLLRWFYIINWEVNTFVDMIKQIFLDIRVFLIVLSVTIVAFANMFQVLLFKPSYECTDGGFCDPKDVYLQMYSIILGKFNLDDFTTTLSLVMFVIFTALVGILLFYALIAIVIESHSKFITARFSTALPSHGNRARLVYVAHLRAFRRMVEQKWSLMQFVSIMLFLASSGLIMALCLREIRDHFDEFYGDTLYAVTFSVLILFVFVSILAFVSHMTYFELAEENGERAWLKYLGGCIVKTIAWPIKSAMLFFLGVSDEERIQKCEYSLVKSERKSPEDIAKGWAGSAVHMHTDVKRMIDSAQEQTNNIVLEELTSMEGRLKDSSERSRSHCLADVHSSQERLERMMADIQSFLSQVSCERVNESVTSGDIIDAPVPSSVRRLPLPGILTTIDHTSVPYTRDQNITDTMSNLIELAKSSSPSGQEESIVGTWSVMDGSESF